MELEVPAVARAVLHALQLAEEDLRQWCGNLSDVQLNARPAGVAPVAFHIRHLARSLDRLLTYAEGVSLREEQLANLQTELDPGATRDDLFHELNAALATGAARVRRWRIRIWKRREPWAASGFQQRSEDCSSTSRITPSAM
jgi:hypothetical protein